MRVELGQARAVKTKDPKLVIVRKATTAASSRYGIGGHAKKVGGPKAVTLPRLKFLEGDDDGRE